MTRRPVTLPSWAILLLSVCAAAPALAAFDEGLPYPTQVALSQEGDKGFVFRRFPTSQRLYIYDLDSDGHSACNDGCLGARPPVIAPAGAKPMGEWTTIRREEGRLQWAYRGHPVYTFFHDGPSEPHGDGEGGVWHLMPYEK
jgi:predicted lipoprotein with Yx(FWY)xxD motif